MLDRERSLSTSAIATHGPVAIGSDTLAMNSGSTNEPRNPRVHQTTIAPQPYDDGEDEPTRAQAVPRADELDRLELDEPRPSESSLDSPSLNESDLDEAALGGLALDEPGLDDSSPFDSAPDVDEPTRVGASSSFAGGYRLGDTNEQAHPLPSANLPGRRPPPPANAPLVPPLQLPAVRRLSVPPPRTPTGSYSSAPPPRTPTGSYSSAPPPRTPTGSHSSAPPSATAGEQEKPDRWYLRVQLNTDCVADLWVRDLTPHNVLVWSDDMETWVPLLTVRELRDAIRDAHDTKTREQLQESSLVFVNTEAPQDGQQSSHQTRSQLGTAAPAPMRAAGQWALPRPRTISNVPPPLLTTAVPVVASPSVQHGNARAQATQYQGAHSLARRNNVEQLPLSSPTPSSVPPVVTSIELAAARYQEAVSLPDIPRPARVPAVEGVLPYETSRRSSNADQPQLRRLHSPLPSVNLRPWQRAVVVTANSVMSSIPLVHLERFLWLAAGVAVASAVMLLMRDSERELTLGIHPARMGEEARESAQPHKAAPPAERDAIPVQRVGSAARASSDIHRLEDLPVVGAHPEPAAVPASVLPTVHSTPAVPATPAAAPAMTKGIAAPRGPARAAKERFNTAGGTVAPANITLASGPANVTPPPSNAPNAASTAASTGSGFDTAAARRILSSSASRAARCASEGPASGSVLITFAPTGFVQNATMAGLSGNGVNVGCVLRAFQEARVSPFTGGAVTVRKGFQIQ
jgi:hypothetical protein